jgi:hypothetical protein
MNPQRLAMIAALSREVAVPSLVVLCIAGFGPAGLEKTGAAPAVNRIAPSLAANTDFAGKSQVVLAAAAPQAIVIERAQPVAADTPQAIAPTDTEVAKANETATAPTEVKTEATAEAKADTASTTDTQAAAPEPHPIVTAALGDPSEVLPETPSAKVETESAAGPDDGASKPIVGSVETLDECYVMAACVDRYLFALYQRTPKEDSIKESEQRKVTVKRKGKMVTVTRTFTKLVDEDFGWKDPKAADKARMSMQDYVIGGMDPSFKMKLVRLLIAAEQAGLSPGITSAFRDDYRQSIASGLKAASDRSYHGGSFRGGYGHGLAADITSVNGATRNQRYAASEVLWKWVDLHGKEFGVGRPYLDRDPPHVGPMDGLEYVSKRGGTKTANAESKRRSAPAARADRSPGKRAKTRQAVQHRAT